MGEDWAERSNDEEGDEEESVGILVRRNACGALVMLELIESAMRRSEYTFSLDGVRGLYWFLAFPDPMTPHGFPS